MERAKTANRKSNFLTWNGKSKWANGKSNFLALNGKSKTSKWAKRIFNLKWKEQKEQMERATFKLEMERANGQSWNICLCCTGSECDSERLPVVILTKSKIQIQERHKTIDILRLIFLRWSLTDVSPHHDDDELTKKKTMTIESAKDPNQSTIQCNPGSTRRRRVG